MNIHPFCKLLMLRLFSLPMLLSTPLFALTEYPTVDAAVEACHQDARCIMLNFTGTDWCTACIHLKNKILDSDSFNRAMDKKLVLVEVDFPRNPVSVSKIPAEEWKKRESMLVSYRAEGLPFAVLLDSQGYPFATLSGTSRTAQDYISRLDIAFASLAARDAAIKKAASLTGIERARTLAEALNHLPEVCRDKYRDLVQEITELDKENTLGYLQYVSKSETRIKQMQTLNKILSSIRGKNAPQQLHQHLEILDAFLATPDLEPDVRQQALRAKSDTYAFLRDFPNMLKYMKEAYEVAPKSRLGKKLEINIRYTEENIIPKLEQHPNN